jgi:cathepsin L
VFILSTHSSLIALLLVGVVSCYTENEYKGAFTNWIQKYKRFYLASEFQNRYTIFKANMDFVKEWNENPANTHTVGLNLFADLSNTEYRKIYLGTHFDGSERLANAGPHVNVSSPMADVINWAAKGAVTPIKNQGACGSCWSFSTTGSVEALNFIYTGNLISLSEQNLMDCSSSYGNKGCSGGWMDSAFQYIINNNGIDREADYPYNNPPAVGPCRFSAAWTGATMKGYSDIQSGNEAALTAAVNSQPVSVAIDASQQNFQLYTGGIYYSSTCSSSSLDHGVLVIGYGSDNGDYYIVKNSWGTTWGLAGYIWMSRGANNNCGIATAASIPLAQ